MALTYSGTRIDVSGFALVSDSLKLYQRRVSQVPNLGPGKARTIGTNYAVRDLTLSLFFRTKNAGGVIPGYTNAQPGKTRAGSEELDSKN
jgi:hypothetical protein